MVASLQLRLTALATLVVFVVLGLGAASLVLLQEAQLQGNVDQSLRERAETIEALLAAGALEESFTADDGDRAVQVVDSAGTVVVASANIVGEVPIVELGSDVDETINTLEYSPLGDDSFRVLSRRVDGALGPVVLHVAENTDDLDDSGESLRSTLTAAVPVIAVVFAVLTWWLVGRTLRPVDALRAEADSIADTRHLAQLPEPDRDDEIGRLARTLNRMLRRLHVADERQRRFVADAAHELRTPLTRIRTTVEVDLAQPARAVAARTNAEVQREAIGLQELIDDLLLLAASDDGNAAVSHSPVDLDDVVMDEIREQRLDSYAVTIDASRVSACDVSGDAAQLRRAVRNLLSNAARHAHETVAVELSRINGTAVLHVDDDGPGVPHDQRDVVFQRFTRLDEARVSDQGGAGLGLAITRDIAGRHRGTVTCGESPLGGARFTIVLPASTS